MCKYINALAKVATLLQNNITLFEVIVVLNSFPKMQINLILNIVNGPLVSGFSISIFLFVQLSVY